MASRLLTLVLLLVCFSSGSQVWGQGFPAETRFEDPQQVYIPSLQDFHRGQLPFGTGQPVFQSPNPDVIAPVTLPPHMPVMGYQTQPGMSYYDGAATVTSRAAEINPNDPWEQPSEFEKMLHAVAKNSWFRADYLYWSMSSAGNEVLGHDQILVDGTATDSRGEFVWTTLVNNVETGVAGSRALDLDGISFQDQTGFQGTFGVPLVFGEFQASSFVLGEASDTTYGSDPPPSLTQNVLTTASPDSYYFLPKYYLLPVTVDGQVAGPIGPELVYDDLRVRMANRVWGGNVKFLIDLPNSKQYGLVTRPVIGATYLSIMEKIQTDGVRTDDGGVWNNTGEVHISQDSYNNLYGATVGLNLEFRHQYFTLGVEPKGLIGFNSYQTRVKTRDLAFAGEETSVQDNKTRFSPLLDLQAYARVGLSESFSLFLAYDLKYASKVARPQYQTQYNVIGDGAGGISATDFSVSNKLENFKVNGLTIGGEFRFH